MCIRDRSRSARFAKYCRTSGFCLSIVPLDVTTATTPPGRTISKDFAIDVYKRQLTYHRKGDYLFPNLTIQETEVQIGKYGMLRRTFLKEHKNSLYQSLLLTGKLNSHLEEIEKTAQKRLEVQMAKLLEKNPAPSKEENPMAWTAHMNSLTATAEESILTELVYS